jgi:hypothetical protein
MLLKIWTIYETRIYWIVWTLETCPRSKRHEIKIQRIFSNAISAVPVSPKARAQLKPGANLILVECVGRNNLRILMKINNRA